MNKWKFTIGTQEDATPDTAFLLKFVEDLAAKSTEEIVARAQATIAAVEAGNAASVGLVETAGIHAVMTELVYREVGNGLGRRAGVDAAQVSKLGNLQAKLSHQLRQSAAWQYRVNKVVPKDAGLGRNDSRVQRRILNRGTSTSGGCFDEALYNFSLV